jgi:hypothetical protein
VADKFLLYIDILGFSDLVIRGGAIHQLYNRIDSLNAHRHNSFKCIVFSDTILVYNIDDLDWTDTDVTHIVTRLCEFSEDLLYRLVSMDIHFRAYLCRGRFSHSHLQNIEAFYGEALIRAHTKERDIQCTGLFVENTLVLHLGWYKSDQYDAGCHFVHLMQTLNNISYDEKDYPLNWQLITPFDYETFAAYDISHLKNIHTHMNDMNLPPRVRTKYLTTWQMLERRHSKLLTVLARSGFNPHAVCDLDWSYPMGKIGTQDGFFG